MSAADGISKDSLGFVNAGKAPELMVPEFTGEDLSFIAGPGGAHGYQPITSTNPDGDYAAIPVMTMRG